VTLSSQNREVFCFLQPLFVILHNKFNKIKSNG
jgi:hypothetical protein